MTFAFLSMIAMGHRNVSPNSQNKKYDKINLNLLENLCTDIILGTDFQEFHDKLNYRISSIDEETKDDLIRSCL